MQSFPFDFRSLPLSNFLKVAIFLFGVSHTYNCPCVKQKNNEKKNLRPGLTKRTVVKDVFSWQSLSCSVYRKLKEHPGVFIPNLQHIQCNQCNMLTGRESSEDKGTTERWKIIRSQKEWIKRTNKEEREENTEVMDRFYITFFSRKMIEGENVESIRSFKQNSRGNQSEVRVGQWGRGHWIAS